MTKLKLFFTVALILAAAKPLAGPITIDLNTQDIIFPSMILGINDQCRLNYLGTKSRNACADSRVVNFTTQIADGTLTHERRRYIDFICPSGWQNMEGGAWQYQIRFRIANTNRRCGQRYRLNSGTLGEDYVNTFWVYARIRINNWTAVSDIPHVIPVTFQVEYE